MLTHTISKQSRRSPASLNRCAKFRKQNAACLIRICDAHDAHIILKSRSRREWSESDRSEKFGKQNQIRIHNAHWLKSQFGSSIAVADWLKHYFLSPLSSEQGKHVALNSVERSQDVVSCKIWKLLLKGRHFVMRLEIWVNLILRRSLFIFDWDQRWCEEHRRRRYSQRYWSRLGIIKV